MKTLTTTLTSNQKNEIESWRNLFSLEKNIEELSVKIGADLDSIEDFLKFLCWHEEQESNASEYLYNKNEGAENEYYYSMKHALSSLRKEAMEQDEFGDYVVGVNGLPVPSHLVEEALKEAKTEQVFDYFQEGLFIFRDGQIIHFVYESDIAE